MCSAVLFNVVGLVSRPKREYNVSVVVTLPVELLRELDEEAERRGYRTRSDVVREAVKRLLEEWRRERGEEEESGLPRS